MMGATNLFIFILNFPHLSTARSDIALLEIVAGHCGRLELITDSEVSYSFPRELAALARRAMTRSPMPMLGRGEATVVGGGGHPPQEILGIGLDVSLPGYNISNVHGI